MSDRLTDGRQCPPDSIKQQQQKHHFLILQQSSYPSLSSLNQFHLADPKSRANLYKNSKSAKTWMEAVAACQGWQCFALSISETSPKLREVLTFNLITLQVTGISPSSPQLNLTCLTNADNLTNAKHIINTLVILHNYARSFCLILQHHSKTNSTWE